MTFAVRPWVIGVPAVPLIAYRDAWSYCQRALFAAVGNEAYITWLGGLKFVEVDKRGKVLRLTVATPFLRRWIRLNYHGLLLEVCRAEWPTLVEVEISVRSCVIRDMRSVPVLLLSGPKPVPVYRHPWERFAPYTPERLFPGHPDVPKVISSGRLTEDIQRLVAHYYGVKRTEILSERRTAKVVKARQVAMYLTKKLTSRSLPEIGRRFGGRDHTTVLHAVRKIEGLVARDTALRDEVESLKRQLQE